MPTTWRARLRSLAAAGALLGVPAAAVGAAPWSAPITLSPPAASQPGGPAVAVSAEGRAIVSWWRRPAAAAAGAVQAHLRAGPGAPFIGPQDLSPGIGPARPAVAAAAGSRVVAGWDVPDGPRRGVRVRVPRVPGGPPGATTAFPEGAGRIADVAVGIDGAGGAVAVWTRDPGSPGPAGGDVRVRVATLAPGATWSAASDLSGPGATRPALAVGADGAAVAAWERAGTVEVTRRDGAAAAFGPPAVVAAPGAAARRPAVAADGGGRAVVAWIEAAVMVADLPATGPPGPPTPVSAPGGIRGGAPRIALARDGRAVAAWRRSAGGRLGVEAAARGPGAPTWAPPVALAPPAARAAGAPAVALAGGGAAVVAWSQPIGRTGTAVRARVLSPADTTFARTEVVSVAARRGTAPSAGIDAAGRAVVAWREQAPRGRGATVRTAVRLPVG